MLMADPHCYTAEANTVSQSSYPPRKKMNIGGRAWMLESQRRTLNPALTIFQLCDQDKLLTILNMGWMINSVLTFQEEEINDEL